MLNDFNSVETPSFATTFPFRLAEAEPNMKELTEEFSTVKRITNLPCALSNRSNPHQFCMPYPPVITHHHRRDVFSG